jgi:hypothetical protein
MHACPRCYLYCSIYTATLLNTYLVEPSAACPFRPWHLTFISSAICPRLTGPTCRTAPSPRPTPLIALAPLCTLCPQAPDVSLHELLAVAYHLLRSPSAVVHEHMHAYMPFCMSYTLSEALPCLSCGPTQLPYMTVLMQAKRSLSSTASQTCCRAQQGMLLKLLRLNLHACMRISSPHHPLDK